MSQRTVIDLCSTEEESYDVEEVSIDEPTPPAVVFCSPLVAPQVTLEMVNRNAAAAVAAPAKKAPRKARTQAGTRVTRVVFTLNNYTEEEHNWICDWVTDNCKWAIVAKETGAECQTPHLQGNFVSYVVSF